MVAEGEGRKDGATQRLSGRAPDNRLVHFARPEERSVRVTSSPWTSPTPRRTTCLPRARPGRAAHPSGRRVGEAQRRRGGETRGVMLGLPNVGAPPPVPAPAAGCGCD